MAVGDEDVAIRRGHDVARLLEMIGAAARHAGGSESQQHAPVGAELHDLLAFRPVLAAGGIGDPDVAISIDMQAVREHEESGADAFRGLARRKVEQMNRR